MLRRSLGGEEPGSLGCREQRLQALGGRGAARPGSEAVDGEAGDGGARGMRRFAQDSVCVQLVAGACLVRSLTFRSAW